MKRLLTLLLALVMAIGCFASCKGNNPSSSSSNPGSSSDTGDTGSSGDPTQKTYTYNTYTTVSPSNWNELTYQDKNDTQIMNYLAGTFFSFDFKYDSKGDIIDGEFEVKYDFATALEDVTDVYGEEYGLDPKTPNHVWKITIRNDGKWDDGTPIKAQDFVYSMKEQLNPLFKNYRADSYYNGSVNLVNAKNYVFQGSTVDVDNGNGYKLNELTAGEDGVYRSPKGGNKMRFALKTKLSWLQNKTLDSYVTGNPTYFDVDAYNQLKAKAGEDGFVDVTNETIELMAKVITASAAWGETREDVINYMVYEYTYPELGFDKVGIKAVGDYEIVVAMTDPIVFIEDGKLTYHAPYEFASLPLVHKVKYEANKVKPATDGALWTSTYNSSLASTASWGPYKLTDYQSGTYYKLEKNPNWYGWNMDRYQDRYQTDVISCRTIDKYETAFLTFRQGKLDDIGIDVSVAADYKNSKQAYFTPSDFVGSIQLQSDAEQLKKRGGETGVNKMLLTYVDFRKALSLGLNRADFVNKCTTSSLAGYGLYNSMHYIDVANGITYRSTDAAKKALCDVYGIDVEEYDDLDAAVNAITGYDKEQAKQLIRKAYAEALAAGDIKAGDKVSLELGYAVDNSSIRRIYDYLKATWTDLMDGTPLKDKFELTFSGNYGDDWAEIFQAGGYDVCLGGWSGAPWNPGYFIAAYVSPANMFSQGWDTESHNIEITVHGVDAEGKVTNNENDVYKSERAIYGTKGDSWYELLNGKYGQGFLNDEFRCEILAQMEAEVLKQYYSVPYSNSFSATLHSFKIDYVTYTYNTFCGYGGIEYLKYNYSDQEWADYVTKNAQGGELNYK